MLTDADGVALAPDGVALGVAVGVVVGVVLGVVPPEGTVLGVDPAGGAALPGAADADGVLPPFPLWCFLPLCCPAPGVSLGAGALGTTGCWITFRFVVDAVAAYPHRDGAR